MIGIIFTGGTIGSTAGEQYIATDSSKSYKLIEMYREQYGDDVEMVTDSPYEILSENMTCREYPLLAEAVKRMLDRGVSGVIVTHGSDTLQYSAAFLSYVIPQGSVPVMLVASNYVLEDERANGLINFACAVDFIKNSCGRGVYVPYRNRDGIVRIYYGNNILPHDACSDELRSLQGIVYGDYAEGYFVPSGIACPTPVALYDVPRDTAGASEVLVIHPYPGMKYPSLEGYKAVLHCSYHSGTICTGDSSYERMLEEAGERNIPVYYICDDREKQYASCELNDRKNIIKLSNITEISAYIVVWLSVNMKI